MKKVFVLGSINTDLTVSADRLPMRGESLKGYGFMSNQGGKGANQAVACKKIGGGNVYLLGAVGNDRFGRELRASVQGYGVDVGALETVEDMHSGVCLAILDQSAHDNVLVVDIGANDCVDPAAVRAFLCENAEKGDIFVSQLEVNREAVREGLSAATERGMYRILNPAPAANIDDIMRYVDLIVLNETEAELICKVSVTDEESMNRVYAFFAAAGIGEVIVTLGAKGSYYSDGTSVFCPARKVKAKDSTCAGDTFIGALAARRANGFNITDSLDYASACSAITVSRAGASVSIPTAEEVAAYLR
ncbi:MAG: ribokinase, partial [Clostridiales bacterium]|nr:ribokinase [Clostridiales bacterium]